MGNAVVLRGTIAGYRAERKSANFFFTQSEQRALGMAAIGVAVVGASGVAMGTAIGASDIEEDADQVDFCVDGRKVSGWVWRSPFVEGDEVEVVAELSESGCAAVAITRPKDRMIALYPHLTRGRQAHLLNAFKWWALIVVAFVILFTAFMAFVGWTEDTNLFQSKIFGYIMLAEAAVVLLMLPPFIHLTWKYMRFVRSAETVFRTLGWKGASRVDLVKSSKAGRRGDEAAEYGVYYFRY